MDEQKDLVQTEQTEEEALVTTSASAVPKGFWTDMNAIKVAYKIANMLSKSSLVPQAYKNNPVDCMIAMEMTSRTNFPLLMVMQNLYIIQGKPSWSGQFCTAVVNSSGRFSPLEFIQLVDDNNKVDGNFCRATRLADGKICEGSPVTWAMVKGEGWDSKSGSKWKTMPDLMFHYRAAAFFVREHCPDLLCGLQTSEEVQDVKGYVRDQDTVRIAL